MNEKKHEQMQSCGFGTGRIHTTWICNALKRKFGSGSTSPGSVTHKKKSRVRIRNSGCIGAILIIQLAGNFLIMKSPNLSLNMMRQM